MRGRGWWVWALVLIAACDRAPASQATGFLDSGARRLETALCERAVRCRTVDAVTVVDCLAAQAVSPTTFNSPQALVDSIAAGRIQLDEAQADACIEAITQETCSPTFTGLQDIEACARAFVGQVPNGSRCITDFACLAGTSCRPTASTTDSACVATCSTLGPRECRNGLDCAQGEFCEFGTCTGIRAQGGLGQPCGTGGTCEPGLLCLPSSPTTDFICAPPPGINTTCFLGPGITCDTDLLCVPDDNFSAGVCVPPASIGAPCSLAMQCGGPGSNLVCDPVQGRCVVPPSTGPCLQVSSTGFCDEQRAFCDVSFGVPVCVPFRPLGTGCASDRECGPLTSNVRCVFDPGGAGLCTEVRRERCVP